jgi:site-specific recombinase XerD
MVQHQYRLKADDRYLKPGFLTPHLQMFLGVLQSRGYTSLTIENYAESVCHFSQWAQMQRISVEEIKEEMLCGFAKHRCRCPGSRKHDWVSRKYVERVRRFVGYLRESNLLATTPVALVRGEPQLVTEFIRWLCEHRGIGPVTVGHYRHALSKLPGWLLDTRTRVLTASHIRSLVLERAPLQSSSMNRVMLVTMRMYLRFLGATGRCAEGLEGAIPAMPCWRLTALPRYLPTEQIDQLILSCDTRTLLGTRDRAIVLLLARLGLRAGDVAGLRFDDLNWRAARVKVCGKSRREVWLPLPQDAGDAMLKYLKKRPTVPVDRVFLCMQAPFRSINAGVVSSIVAHALRRAGIKDAPTRGATLLRHSAATSMLRGGATLDTVSTMLRHRSLDMTAHYAKVDVPMLKRIAQPWPEGVSC